MTQIEIVPIETADKENHENSHEDERKTIGCEPPDKVWTTRAILVIATTFMSMFLVALDRTIIATVCLNHRIALEYSSIYPLALIFIRQFQVSLMNLTPFPMLGGTEAHIH